MEKSFALALATALAFGAGASAKFASGEVKTYETF